LADKKRTEALDFIGKAYESGVDLDYFLKHFLQYARKVLIAKIHEHDSIPGDLLEGDDPRQLADFAKKMDGQTIVSIISRFTTARNDLRSSPIPQLPLELAVIELTEERNMKHET